MASYGAGRGVNVSQYLRNLRVPESAVEETLVTDEDLAKDLALFTNTQFYDFETGQHTDYQAPPAKPEVTQSPTEDVPSTDPIMGFDFVPGELHFCYYSAFPLPFRALFIILLFSIFCLLCSSSCLNTVSFAPGWRSQRIASCNWPACNVVARQQHGGGSTPRTPLRNRGARLSYGPKSFISLITNWGRVRLAGLMVPQASGCVVIGRLVLSCALRLETSIPGARINHPDK
jgi:hypothetical protein